VTDDRERELRSIVQSTPGLGRLLQPQGDEPDVPEHVLLRRGPSPYFVVPVPMPSRSGEVFTSRTPGMRRQFAEAEVQALFEFGVQRVACLVPTEQLEQFHGADTYLRHAKDVFGENFHQVAIPDHQIPLDDAEFEQCVESIDAALSNGERVLVHCIAGCGRTGMFVACLFVRAGLDPLEGIRAFRRSRRCGPDTVEQMAYAIRYANRQGMVR
jgi:protein-tyrosine phosphatase